MRTHEVVGVTVALARSWLEHSNPMNRTIDASKVHDFAYIMKRGLWVLRRNSNIAFNKSDMLVDGHHRLRAIVVAGVTVPMLVVRGVEDWVTGLQDLGVKV